MGKVVLLENRVGQQRSKARYVECPTCRSSFKRRRAGQQFCSRECSALVQTRPKPSAAEALYRFAELGYNRDALGAFYGVSGPTTYSWLPPHPISKLQRGDMVSIGGILAKRCASCGVTWTLDRFRVSNLAASGCRHRCEQCRGIKPAREV